MKSSLRTLFAAALLGLAVVPMLSLAQDKPTPPPEGGPRGPGGPGGGQRGGRMTPEQMVARLDEAVTLTADQKTKVTEIYKKTSDARQALSGDERREKGMALMKSANDEIRALLTPEQQKKFDDMLAKMGPGGRGPSGSGGPGGRRPEGGGDAPKKE